MRSNPISEHSLRFVGNCVVEAEKEVERKKTRKLDRKSRVKLTMLTWKGKSILIAVRFVVC